MPHGVYDTKEERAPGWNEVVEAPNPNLERLEPEGLHLI